MSEPVRSGRLHDALLVLLVALRPLVWSGDASAWDTLAYLGLVMVALTALVVETWQGLRPTWRWGWGGILATALLLALLPAALNSPFPSNGMGFWGMLTIHLGLAVWLMQVLPGRERLAVAALGGTLAVECVITLAQQWWVLPQMAAQLAAQDPALIRLETSRGELAERIARGGLFGTFTLANTLAAWLVLVTIPFAALTLRCRGWMRLLTGALAALALAAFIGTAIKGAALALVGAGGLLWMFRVTGWQRWLPLAAGMVVLIAALAMPSLQRGVAASAEVRLGYWHGALTLVAERPVSGHGLHGFAAQSPRAMPLWAEPSHHVHNDVLEATVDGGLLAGLLAAALLAWLALARRTGLTAPAELPTRRVAVAAAPLLVVIPLFAALGMLSSNVDWWPGGTGDATWWLWPLVLAALLVAITVVAARLPAPPAWAWQLALAAAALHCLTDFNLQSPGIWGALVLVSCLANGPVRTLTMTRWRTGLATVLTMALTSGLLFGARRSLDLAHGEQLVQQAAWADEALRKPDALEQAQQLAWLVLGERLPPAATASPAILAQSVGSLSAQAAQQATALNATWPRSAELETALVLMSRPGSERLPQTTAAIAHQPGNPTLRTMLSQDLIVSGRWEDAIAAQAEAVRLAPANLTRREQFATLLEHAADALPSQAVALRQRASAERQRGVELQAIVHPRNRR